MDNSKAQDELMKNVKQTAKNIIQECKDNNILKEFFESKGQDAEDAVTNMLLADILGNARDE